MIFRRAVTINWDIIHDERRKLVELANKKENQSRLT